MSAYFIQVKGMCFIGIKILSI